MLDVRCSLTAQYSPILERTVRFSRMPVLFKDITDLTTGRDGQICDMIKYSIFQVDINMCPVN